jgi:hypothetical protein
MPCNSVVISSGHGEYVRGAHGIIDEVDEARKVVERIAEELRYRGIMVKTFHDKVSYTQNENLNRIVDYHNSQVRDLDISVHFNAYEQVDKPMGTECLHVCHPQLAAAVSETIALAGGFINRGAKTRTDLFFLNNTAAAAILIEVCFVDSTADCTCYENFFDDICRAVADLLAGSEEVEEPLPMFYALGTASHFGGPNDTGVSEDEGLAFIDSIADAPQLFLPFQPDGTTGLARRLNPCVNYIACRWDYETTPKDMMLKYRAHVRSTKTDVTLLAFPADWGPHKDTGRVADLSPGLMESLGITTDDEVEVVFPYEP